MSKNFTVIVIYHRHKRMEVIKIVMTPENCTVILKIQDRALRNFTSVEIFLSQSLTTALIFVFCSEPMFHILPFLLSCETKLVGSIFIYFLMHAALSHMSLYFMYDPAQESINYFIYNIFNKSNSISHYLASNA
jgi:hypothetical protein